MEKRMRIHDDDIGSIIKQPKVLMQKKKPRTKKKKTMPSYHEKEEDRISQLPDAILLHILSLTPTQVRSKY
ncbi:hypothetical protein MRB53_026272 [Persea americana]|uniref:Uncharacterized protein n=1 Tax=Persea americana TaxID=3435 RepID=A0ACC2LHP2_PERAE|nr:hypothetical protein MRB53_026272 [Persea americana]